MLCILQTLVSQHYRFVWKRTNTIMGLSEISFYWDISNDTVPGSYRIKHFGWYQYILGGKYSYTGISKVFVVD